MSCPSEYPLASQRQLLCNEKCTWCICVFVNGGAVFNQERWCSACYLTVHSASLTVDSAVLLTHPYSWWYLSRVCISSCSVHRHLYLDFEDEFSLEGMPASGWWTMCIWYIVWCIPMFASGFSCFLPENYWLFPLPSLFSHFALAWLSHYNSPSLHPHPLRLSGIELMSDEGCLPLSL